MEEFSARDHHFMAAALRLAERGIATVRPNPAVGCMIVQADDSVVGQGWHERAGGPHAEVNALREAGDKARDATAYVTLEPCSHQGRTPPCADQLVAAGVSRVIYAVADPNPAVAGQGAQRLVAAGIEVRGGLLADSATELNRGFFSRMQSGRPWVRSKLAVSLDGRTALANGDSQWITGPNARQDVHRWRARSAAVLSSIETVLMDDPSLNARVDGEDEIMQPLRVILDSQLRVSPQAKLFSVDGPVLVVHSRGSAAAVDALREAGATVASVAEEGDRVALGQVLQLLAGHNINDIWVEAGAVLNGALLEAQLIDELIVYQAPCVLGSGGRGMFDLQSLDSMQNRPEFELSDVRKVGADVRLTYLPRYN